MSTAILGEQGRGEAEHGPGEHPWRVPAPHAGTEVKHQTRDTADERSSSRDEDEEIHNRQYMNGRSECLQCRQKADPAGAPVSASPPQVMLKIIDIMSGLLYLRHVKFLLHGRGVMTHALT